MTKSDLNHIENLLEVQEDKFEDKIVEVKNDFYYKIDPILKEVVASQEERTMLSHRVSDHGDRIGKVEMRLSHFLATDSSSG